ncbi:MORN repeat-containing protein [Telluria aromaticivorans]|uniref:TonB C-terminal domain-containing protein n=1 Tax=Telluria aromaticivorans TaxID=2725995 RepID=A0A7Y2K1F8_9BURK|nr:hypothetical protein [Telluria aromaticivorans]NNG24917.1 hypothetical protein [Telluria aromaticivorans]
MTRLSRSLLAFIPLLCGLVHAAEPVAYLGKADCRIAPLLPAPVNAAVSWSGACKDGYAEGKGVLEWQVVGDSKRRLEGVLVRGELGGEGTLTYEAGKYIGTLRQGMPHGTGYFEYAKGGQYEGGVVDGRPEGTGVQIALDGSTYQGEWKTGRRHGAGKAVFTLGGSYEGEWRNGRFHGLGKIVYNGSGRTYSGEFVDHRALGATPMPSGDYERFGLRDEYPSVGSHVRRDRVHGAVAPVDATWQALTPEQQNIMRNAYPALDDDDEPPYPLKGTRAFYAGVANLYRKFTDFQGDALVYVTVGADGVPVTTSTYGVKHQEFGRYLSMIAMLQRFKPAQCAGSPCQMIFPIRFRFYLK